MHEHHDEAETPTARLRHEHEIILKALGLLERLGQRVAHGESVNPPTREWLSDFFVTFVDRCHHGKEEQHLFPALERHGLPRDGGPIGVMLLEHEEGRGLLRVMRQRDEGKIAETIREYGRLLRAHIDKENHILFPLAEQVVPGQEQQLLMQAFDAVEEVVVGRGIHERLLTELGRLEAEGDDGVLDVRAVPPKHRHPMIFGAFDRLSPGAVFILVNDHDPKPLYYQFAAERPGTFTWRYLEEGPDVWKVEIGKPSA